MAAAEKQDDWWVNLQQRREERMRFEVLALLYEASERCAGVPVEVRGFVRKLGVWEDELNRVLSFLIAIGYLESADGVARTSVCLTVRGVDYIERDAFRRRTIRE